MRVAGGAAVQDHLPDDAMGGAAVEQDQASDEVSLEWPLLATAVAAWLCRGPCSPMLRLFRLFLLFLLLPRPMHPVW